MKNAFSDKHMNLALELSRGLKKTASENFGGHEDKEHPVGFGGDTTYEVDVPMEEYVSEFFASKRLPAKVVTEDKGEVDYSSGRPEAVYLIDPLDGSRNLRRSLPVSCCSIAVFKPDADFIDEAVACVIQRFDADEEYVAVKGAGASLNGTKITCSGKKDLKDAVVIFGAHFASSMGVYADFMRKLASRKTSQASDAWSKTYGSTALELAFLASGKADAVVELRASSDAAFTPKTYDIAAGMMLCEEAGVHSKHGSRKLGERVPIDPTKPVQYVGAGSKELFEEITGCI